MSFTLALVGRPNVGKSTLFNRLTGTKHALVHDRPGVTRDWREGKATLAGLRFKVMDTAGLEESDADSVEGRMWQQTLRAIELADAVLFMLDGHSGVLPHDAMLANELRQLDKPVILAINKCDSPKLFAAAVGEAHALGLGDPFGMSAEHGDGILHLSESITAAYEKLKNTGRLPPDDDEKGQGDKPVQIAIIGRPNAGKSTLMNAYLGQERVLTGPQAGMTRDAIAVTTTLAGKPVTLVDTAGIRRRTRRDDQLEEMAVRDGLRVIRFAQVVIVVVDVLQGFAKQDLTLLREVIEEGRALVVAANKWDQVEQPKLVEKQLQIAIEEILPQVRGVPIIPISAIKQKGLDALIKAAFRSYDVWNKRVSTAALNRFLQDIVASHPPPLVQKRRIKLRYMTQVKSRPPTFAIFSSRADALPVAYQRYIINELRKSFKLPGVPVRILLRKGDNPYAPKKKRGK